MPSVFIRFVNSLFNYTKTYLNAEAESNTEQITHLNLRNRQIQFNSAVVTYDKNEKIKIEELILQVVDKLKRINTIFDRLFNIFALFMSILTYFFRIY